MCTLSDDVVQLIGVGTCTVTANQLGNDIYAPATATQSFLVAKATQAITFTSTPPAPATLGASYTVTATGGASGNPVEFAAAPDAVCTIEGAVVTFTGVGRCVITATQAGNEAFEDAPSVTQEIAVEYAFGGFESPVRTDGPNIATAGQTIPLKWHLADANGAPVTTLSAVTVTVMDIGCALGSTADLTSESATGPNGLKNLGGGTYQYNWKTPKSYAGSCKRLQLDLGDGMPRTVDFMFTR